MGTYTALAKNSSSSDEWFTNDYEPTAADHGPDVLYEIARDQICAFRWRTDSDELSCFRPVYVKGRDLVQVRGQM